MPHPTFRVFTLFSIIAASIGGACHSGGGGAGTTSGTSVSTSSAGGAHGSSSSTSVSASSVGGAHSTSSSSATGSSTASSVGGGGPTGTPVRVVSANLTSGSNQSYDGGEGIRILQGIHADVILLQEFNIGANGAADLTGLVDSVCGANCTYVRGPTAQIPNGIITSYPILSSGSWTDALVSNRTFVWAQIDVPGSKDLWAISVHLLTTSATARANEATAIVSNIMTSIPAGDYVVLGGDLNTDIRTEPALAAFAPVFVVGTPFPADQNDNDNTSGPRTKPHDWVLENSALDARRIPAVIGTTPFANGAVIDTRIYAPLTDIAPALMGDSGASGMQHMAVVKDFALE